MRKPVFEYIRDNWDKTLRHSPEAKENLIPLPFPYIVPSPAEMFQEIYYWDTFYTNEGLLRQDRLHYAKDNARNILHLIDRYGKMPNGNRLHYLNRSQPPHALFMVEAVAAAEESEAFLEAGFETLLREYDFWMRERGTPAGLNRYFHAASEAELDFMVEYCNRRRFPLQPESREERLKLGSHLLAEAESGWDFNPRFGLRCADFCPVDLNALLYRYETVLARLAKKRGDGRADLLEKSAADRKNRFDALLWDGDRKGFFDHDFVNGTRSAVTAASAFYPYWLLPCDEAQVAGLLPLLKALETPHGLLTCVPSGQERSYQWDAPNGWAPLHYAAYKALNRHGFRAEAERVAEKFLKTVTRVYERNGKLWEKYNMMTGDIDVKSEYELPELMGWTAGVFVFFHLELGRP